VPEGRATFVIDDPASPGSDTVQSKARFDLPDEEPPEETIVITAPFSAHTDEESAPPAPENQPTASEPSPAGDATVQDPADVIEVITLDDDGDDAEGPRRRGLLRRTLAGLRSLFGRSRDMD
jgi:hypothetical protein